MPVSANSPAKPPLMMRCRVWPYFVLTFAISWVAALAVAAPSLLRQHSISKLTAILVFPAMLLGPSIAGIALSYRSRGPEGLRDLKARLLRWRLPAVWYAPLLIPPVVIPLLLWLMERFVSPVYAPNHFWIGVLFGLPAGYLEEIGWMGYGYPAMLGSHGEGGASIGVGRRPLAMAVWLGLLWALWHLPVSDFLGAAHPHGAFWLPFYLGFALIVSAMRVLICWMYVNTGSVLLAQLMHASSTGALVVFGAFQVTARQEAIWYAIYGLVLWCAVAVVVAIFGPGLRRAGHQPG